MVNTRCMTRRQFIALFIAAAFAFAARAAGAADLHNSPEAKRIVALVNDAARLVAEKGKDAYPELRKDKKWMNGATYVFVLGFDGVLYVNPGAPDLEGTNRLDQKDSKGKLVARDFIVTAKSKGAGWVDYYFPKPGEKQPSKKISYVKKARLPSGEEVVVGAGIYAD
jgi:signal transduction histidine kinase